MSKIAIISQPDQGVLIDISGCIDLAEATEILVSSLQVSSQMPEGTNIDLKIGPMLLSESDVDKILLLALENNVRFSQVFASNNETKAILKARNLSVVARAAAAKSGEEKPAATECQVSNAEEKAEAAISGFAGPGLEASSDTTTSKPIETPPAVLYLKQNLRSGQSVTHKGHLVIFGDVNPGAEVIADGDITVWGALRGIAHAGVAGNTKSEIRALRLQPIQIRIANAIARAPDKAKSGSSLPETARVVNGQIRIQANIPE